MTNTINFAAAQNAANVRPAYAFLAENGIEGAWAVYTASDNAEQFEEQTIRDIVFKLERYGSISPKQVAFLRSLLDRIAQRATRALARAAENAAAADAPTGRREFTGEILKIKYVDSQFGTQVKVLLKTADGWKAWGTLPRALQGTYTSPAAVAGDVITLTATLEPSKDDSKFAFFARPTGATLAKNPEAGQ